MPSAGLSGQVVTFMGSHFDHVCAAAGDKLDSSRPVRKSEAEKDIVAEGNATIKQDQRSDCAYCYQAQQATSVKSGRVRLTSYGVVRLLMGDEGRRKR
jgi:hypothetical protein